MDPSFRGFLGATGQTGRQDRSDRSALFEQTRPVRPVHRTGQTGPGRSVLKLSHFASDSLRVFVRWFEAFCVGLALQ